MAPAKRGRQKKRGPGRPPLLTPRVKKALLEEVARGASYTDACILAGVSVPSFMAWKARGAKETTGQFREFLEDLERARVERRQFFRNSITSLSHTKKDWRGIAFLASVTEPEQFAQKVHLVVEQELGLAIDRLKREFANEHAILERAISALAGEIGAERAAQLALPPGSAAGHVVDAEPA